MNGEEAHHTWRCRPCLLFCARLDRTYELIRGEIAPLIDHQRFIEQSVELRSGGGSLSLGALSCARVAAR